MAHNLDSVKNLVDSLLKLSNKKTYFVFNIKKEKDLPIIIKLFQEFTSECEWLISELNNPRAQKLTFIKKILRKIILFSI